MKNSLSFDFKRDGMREALASPFFCPRILKKGHKTVGIHINHRILNGFKIYIGGIINDT